MQYQLDIYRRVAAVGDEADQASSRALEAEVAEAKEHFGKAAAGFPTFGADLRKADDRFAGAIDGDCGRVNLAAKAAQTPEEVAKVFAMLDITCRPKLDAIIGDNMKLSDRIIEAKNKQDQEVTDITAWTSLSTLIGFGLATIAILVAAVAAVHRPILWWILMPCKSGPGG